MDRAKKLGMLGMELTGTAILVFTIQVSVAGGAALAPLAIGVVLMTIVYAGGPISGAHYNPAVSVALATAQKFAMADLLPYVGMQLLGGWLGAVVGSIVAGDAVVCNVGETATLTQALVAEVIFAGVLSFVVLSVATHSSVVTPGHNSHYGLAIGGVVLAGAIAVGPISGGAFNPAVALGLALAKRLDSIVYAAQVAVANLLGGVVAALIYRSVAPDQCSNDNNSNGATVGETTSLL